MVHAVQPGMKHQASSLKALSVQFSEDLLVIMAGLVWSQFSLLDMLPQPPGTEMLIESAFNVFYAFNQEARDRISMAHGNLAQDISIEWANALTAGPFDCRESLGHDTKSFCPSANSI